ncbi:unnamed protein product, partial [Didymodactylos carnosus]
RNGVTLSTCMEIQVNIPDHAICTARKLIIKTIFDGITFSEIKDDFDISKTRFYNYQKVEQEDVEKHFL